MGKFVPVFPFLLLLGCSFFGSGTPSQNVFLFKDKDGVYEYSFEKKTENLVWKATDQAVFLDEPYVFIQDTLTFGVQGKLINHEWPEKIKRETYSKNYISVDLKSRRHWVSKKVTYEVYQSDTLKITTRLFNPSEKIESEQEETVKFEGRTMTNKGISYAKPTEPRFYGESTLGQQTVYAEMGNLFMVNGHDTIVLAEFEGIFNPRFGRGYEQPRIHPSGEFAIGSYSEETNQTKRAYLVKIDLTTKEITILKEGHYIHPTFSADGNFVLFKRNLRQGAIDFTWIYDIYWLDLKSNTEYRIGEANDACWKKQG